MVMDFFTAEAFPAVPAEVLRFLIGGRDTPYSILTADSWEATQREEERGLMLLLLQINITQQQRVSTPAQGRKEAHQFL